MFQDSRVAVFEGFAEYYQRTQRQEVAYYQITDLRGYNAHRVFPDKAYVK